jgi:hypothetical protein
MAVSTTPLINHYLKINKKKKKNQGLVGTVISALWDKNVVSNITLINNSECHII